MVGEFPDLQGIMGGYYAQGGINETVRQSARQSLTGTTRRRGPDEVLTRLRR